MAWQAVAPEVDWTAPKALLDWRRDDVRHSDGMQTKIPHRVPRPPLHLSRRDFVRVAGGAAGLVTVGALPGVPLRAGAGVDADLFQLGVASGDPRDNSVVLWTRLAPDPLAGGGMPPEAVSVGVEVARDPAMLDIVLVDEVMALPDLGHSVHYTAKGLEPDRWYWYRFHCGGEASPIGRTRTFPSPNARTRAMRFAVTSCQNYQAGFYAAWLDIAEQDLDFVVFLGDYIYESGVDGDAVRPHDGPQVRTLSAYRNRYALYKLDPALQAAHAAFPFIVTWDDHEVDNNYAGLISDGDEPPAEFSLRRAAAYQAYYEHMPLRKRSRAKGDELRLYRRLRYGDLANIHVLDTRQQRSDQTCGDLLLSPQCEEVFRKRHRMIGRDQEKWLRKRLDRSKARWNVLAQQVMMMQWDVGSALGAKEPLINNDQWDGYPRARNRLLDFVSRRDVRNLVVLTGDIHSAWAGDLRTDYRDPDSPVVGSEFVATSISSNFPAGQVDLVPLTFGVNPHIKYFNGLRRGWLRCDVDRRMWKSEFRGVVDALDPGSATEALANWVVEKNVPGPVEA